MKKIAFLLLVPLFAIYAQKKDRIYRSAIDMNDALGYSYNVIIIRLSDDKCYNLIEQRFTSRKFARKNIPINLSKTKGTWLVDNDTLKLIENDNLKKMYFIVKKKHLVYLFNNEVESTHWTEVKY